MAARTCAVLVIALAAVLLAADPVGASTIIPLSDRNLVSSSRAIVVGTVVSSEAHDAPSRGAVCTYVTLDVERVLAGDVPVGRIVLRQLGGATPERVFVVQAAPNLLAGERVLLFLNTDEDGSLRVAHMKLGAYRVRRDDATGLEFVDREPGEGYWHRVTSDTITWRASFDEFVRTIESILEESRNLDEPQARADRPAIRLSPPEFEGLRRGGSAAPAFTFLGDGFRWFEPDSDRPVRIKVNNRLAFTPSMGIDEVKAAFYAWSSVSSSSLRVVFDGTTSSKGMNLDGISSITYGDPKNQIDDLVNCQGVVALASVVGNPAEKVTIGGLSFTRLIESDLILNNGIDCLATPDTTLLQEILTHEFGHDLGLGHSSDRGDEPDPVLRDATMFFVIHNDDRGASLRRDDSDGIRFLYPGRSGQLTIRTTAIPDAVLGQPYERQIDVTGGTSPYSISIVGGSLPSGFTMSPSGRISGTSGRSTESSMRIRVTDSDDVTVERTLTLRLSSSPAPFIETVRFAGSKLQITGLFLAAGSSVTVNGVPTTKVPKFRAARAMIVVKGTAGALNLRGDGTDAVAVTIAGLTSNVFTF